jgi:hypothetical protein
LRTIYTSENYFNNFDGVFGLAYHSIFLSLLNVWNEKYIGIDLNLPEKSESNMIIGIENLKNYKYSLNDITWSDRQSRLTQYFLSSASSFEHQFTMYHLSICGADLFSNYSSNWQVTINTGIIIKINKTIINILKI